jgi:hypothetical protein
VRTSSRPGPAQVARLKRRQGSIFVFVLRFCGMCSRVRCWFSISDSVHAPLSFFSRPTRCFSAKILLCLPLSTARTLLGPSARDRAKISFQRALRHRSASAVDPISVCARFVILPPGDSHSLVQVEVCFILKLSDQKV